MMHGPKMNIPISVNQDGVRTCEAEWGEFHIGFESFEHQTDIAPPLKELPEDCCQSPHWGCVLKGKMTVQTKSAEECVM